MSMKLGICGTGSLAEVFIPLFKLHPLIREVTLCDLDAAKLRSASDRFGIPLTCPSLGALCDTDVDAIALTTQHWLHAPQAIQALRAGKHVFSAVPPAITLDEMRSLVETVGASGLIYMLAETSYYYPAVIYCRERFRQGGFGRIVYAEAEYYHDFDHGLYDVMKVRAGRRWREYAGFPPMYYPTHSTSQVMSITGAHATRVSCQGFVDIHEDGLFQADANIYSNTFSNESALFSMSDGSCCRINEFRRVGHPGAVRMAIFGTEGSFEDSLAGQTWATKEGSEIITDLLALRPAAGDAGPGFHPIDRLPEELRDFLGGHMGAEAFLVDDFVQACLTGRLPPNHVWAAARYFIPGWVAHESANLGGALLEVPDLGDPPS